MDWQPIIMVATAAGGITAAWGGLMYATRRHETRIDAVEKKLERCCTKEYLKDKCEDCKTHNLYAEGQICAKIDRMHQMILDSEKKRESAQQAHSINFNAIVAQQSLTENRVDEIIKRLDKISSFLEKHLNGGAAAITS